MSGISDEMMGNPCTPTYNHIVPKAVQVSLTTGQPFRERVFHVVAPGFITFFEKHLDIIYGPGGDGLLLGPAMNVR